MSLKAGFGEYSLPLDVREHLALNYPALPRAFVNGLRVVTKAAFGGDAQDNIIRLERATKLLKTADYFAPEFYPHTNAQLPECVLMALAGEAELECSEDLDSVMPDAARSLLAELRLISADAHALAAPSTSVDARFVALVRLYHDMDDYLDMLHTGEAPMGGDEFAQSLCRHNIMRDEILEAENSQIECEIFKLMRRIDMVHQFGSGDIFWQVGVTRMPEFDEMTAGDLLAEIGLPASDTLEMALELALESRKLSHGLDRAQAFIMLAEEELSAVRVLARHYEGVKPAVLAYLVLQNDLGDEEMMEAVLQALVADGEEIAYIHQAHDDHAMYDTLAEFDRDVIEDYDRCLGLVKLEWRERYLQVVEPEDIDFSTACEQFFENLDMVGEDIQTGQFVRSSLRDAMAAAYKKAHIHHALMAYKIGQETVPSVQDIDQKFTRDALRDYLDGLAPANS